VLKQDAQPAGNENSTQILLVFFDWILVASTPFMERKTSENTVDPENPSRVMRYLYA
jgi:hypothetical protein